MNKHIQVFCGMQLGHSTYTRKPVASKQSSYTLIWCLGLRGDDLASPMAASQPAFLPKCHFRSYQKPGTTLPAHLRSRKVPRARILPSLQRLPRVPCSSVTIMSTSSELINWAQLWLRSEKNILVQKTPALAWGMGNPTLTDGFLHVKNFMWAKLNLTATFLCKAPGLFTPASSLAPRNMATKPALEGARQLLATRPSPGSTNTARFSPRISPLS